MRVLITGADGFIGRALVPRLLMTYPAVELVLVDQHVAESNPMIRFVAGDIADPEVLQEATRLPVDLVFHLASVPGGRAEADFELGLRVNLQGTVNLLEALRARSFRPRAAPPTVVFASTIGVYGVPLPPLIDECTPALPSLSYGAHKLIGEVLVADYTRRGFIDGRSLRLPGIVARPPAPSGMLSAFMSDLIRTLSAGGQFACPVEADGLAWWMSRAQAVDNLLHAASMDVPAADDRRVWLLPVLHASLGDVVAAIARVHGPEVLDRVTYHSNPSLRAQFANLPPLHCPQSLAAGFESDGTLDALVVRAVEDVAFDHRHTGRRGQKE